jgi:hypothetical protein
MDRREVLKSLALITGGMVLVPSCNFSKEDILAAYQNLQITPGLQKLLADLADTIIPSGQLKGAADIDVQDFILVMVNDCMDAERQQSFTLGLQSFNDYCKRTKDKDFAALTKDDKEAVILQGFAIDDQTEVENDKAVRDFLRTTKRFTVQGFLMSEYIMREIKPYKIIPGDYNGAVLISDLKTEKING